MPWEITDGRHRYRQAVGLRVAAGAVRYRPGVAPNSLLKAWEKAYGVP